jgi:hypothetical protein
MSIEKELQSASRKAKSTVLTMISNDIDVCCQTIDDISISVNNEPVYPTRDEIIEWFNNLFQKEFALKILPPKAIEAMLKKGIVMKKQPAEIMNFIVATSEYHVIIGIMLPLNCDYKMDNLIDGFMDEIKYERIDNINYTIISYQSDSPIKEKDNCQRRIFTLLFKIGILKEEEEEQVYTFD